MKSVHTDRYRRFLKLLIAARKDAGVTQQELSGKLGRPQSFVSKIERGERRLDVIEFLDIADAIQFDSHGLIDQLKRRRR